MSEYGISQFGSAFFGSAYGDAFDADNWLLSGFNALQDYLTMKVNAYVKSDTGASVGSQIYEIVMDFPDSADLPKPAEFTKNIIHLAIDDIDNTPLGFGPGYTSGEVIEPNDNPVYPAPITPGTVSEFEARTHEINFDVGVWTSDKSGGSTARLHAYEMLDSLFGGEAAREECFDYTHGVEIKHFRNGRFIVERPNDVRTYRIVGAELVVRVYGRKVTDPVVFADEEPEVTPGVVIGSSAIVDD